MKKQLTHITDEFAKSQKRFGNNPEIARYLRELHRKKSKRFISQYLLDHDFNLALYHMAKTAEASYKKFHVKDNLPNGTVQVSCRWWKNILKRGQSMKITIDLEN